jgi:hypothetical protein
MAVRETDVFSIQIVMLLSDFGEIVSYGVYETECEAQLSWPRFQNDIDR